MLIRECRIVFGGLQSIAWRAARTEQAIIGLPLDPNSLERAQAKLAQETEALDLADFGDGMSPDYRRCLANNLLYKFCVELCLTFLNGSVDPRFADAGSRYLRPVSSGKHGTIPAPYVAGAKDAHLFLLKQEDLAGAGLEVQRQRAPTVIYDERKWIPARQLSGRDEIVAHRLAEALLNDDLTEAADVAAEPMVKLGAELQATGEAKYTQDVMLPQRPLESQFVLSGRSFAKFKHSRPIEELIDAIKREYPGVRAYITFDDIPNKKGLPTNVFSDQDPAYYDPFFANVYVTAIGQPIGLILADTVRTAHAAALRMQDFIAYDTDGLNPPVMTIAEAVACKSYLQNGKHLVTLERPNSDKAWLDNPAPENGRTYVNGTQTTGAQAHFYFETKSALAVPGEDDQITIYCSSQNQGSCQSKVASALGIPNAKVDSKAVRLGGGLEARRSGLPITRWLQPLPRKKPASR